MRKRKAPTHTYTSIFLDSQSYYYVIERGAASGMIDQVWKIFYCQSTRSWAIFADMRAEMSTALETTKGRC